MFKISNLNAYIDDRKILDDFSITINPGEIHAIMGKNGIGKSTLCKIIMGYPNYKVNGSIVYNDIELLGLDTYDIAKNGVMLISQNPPAIEGVTNAEALRSALRERENQNIDIFKFNKQMEEICDKLKIDKSFIHKEINVGASGGERKKIELLHLGILKPSFIILDELDSGLDVDSLRITSENIKKYKAENPSTSILIITHHPKILEYLHPDYVHIMNNGKIIKTGNYDLAMEVEKNGYNYFKDSNNDITKEVTNE